MQRRTRPTLHTRGRNAIIFFYAIPHKPNNHLRTIHPNGANRPTRNPPNEINRLRIIHPNETVGAAPVCPPERPRSGVSIPKYIYASRIMHEDLTMDAPLQDDTGGHTGTAPTKLHHIFPRNPIQTKFRPCAIHPKRNQPSMCNPPLPNSTKPRGVPIPHRGYTFDSAGLASATQPTLGNSASEEATPLGVVLFLIAHHYYTRRMNDFPHTN